MKHSSRGTLSSCVRLFMAGGFFWQRNRYRQLPCKVVHLPTQVIYPGLGRRSINIRSILTGNDIEQCNRDRMKLQLGEQFRTVVLHSQLLKFISQPEHVFIMCGPYSSLLLNVCIARTPAGVVTQSGGQRLVDVLLQVEEAVQARSNAFVNSLYSPICARHHRQLVGGEVSCCQTPIIHRAKSEIPQCYLSTFFARKMSSSPRSGLELCA